MEKYKDANSEVQVQKIRNTEASPMSNFLKKTYDILEDKNYYNIVSWSDDGLTLVIKDSKLFAKIILPAYFKHSNLNSFIRQLNMYNFKKMKSSNHEFVFVHAMFQRGRRDLLCKIRRKSSDASLLSTKSRINLNGSPEQDQETLEQEDPLFKRVQKEVMEKIKSLESRVEELNKQNEEISRRLNKFKESIWSSQEYNPPFPPVYPQHQPTFVLPTQKGFEILSNQLHPHLAQIRNMQSIPNYQRTIQTQEHFPISNISIGPKSMIKQETSQASCSQPNQMNFMSFPLRYQAETTNQQVTLLQTAETPIFTDKMIFLLPPSKSAGIDSQNKINPMAEENELATGKALNWSNFRGATYEVTPKGPSRDLFGSQKDYNKDENPQPGAKKSGI